MVYELFIRDAWNCERFQKGANTDTWESLVISRHEYEDAIGKSNEAKAKKEYEKEFAEVKKYVDNAYVNLLKRVSGNVKLTDSLLDLKNAANNATNPQELFSVLDKSYDIINENKL